MKLIVLDFVRRWWLMVFGVLFFALLTTSVGFPTLFVPAAMFVLLYDVQRGWLRVLRPLPVPVRAQTQALWFIGVWLLSLLLLLVVPLGVIANQVWFKHGSSSPWFVAGISWWVGLGYSAFMFLLAVAMPTGLPTTKWEKLKACLLGLGWGLAIPGSTFISQALPRTPQAMQPWHGWLFASVPVWVWLSYAAAPDMAKRRLTTSFTSPTATATAQEKPEATGGMTGLPLLLKDQVVRYVFIIALMIFVQWLVMELMATKGARFSPMVHQLPFLAVMFGAMSGEGLNLRLLRTLPMSTRKLVGVLLTVPFIMGVITGLMLATIQYLDPSVNSMPFGVRNSQLPFGIALLAYTLSTAGTSSLALVALLRWNSGKRFLIMFPMILVQALSFIFAGQHLLWFIPVGLGLLLLAAWLLQRGLRKSAAFYQPRPLFNAMLGQPFGQR